MGRLNIEYVDIADLRAYDNNAKIHTEEQIEQIKESIRKFGMNDPIAIWQGNEIIEGHGRLLACRELGIESVPVIRLDQLSDEDRRAYMLVHNKLTMNTGFDFSALTLELRSLSDIDMSDFGFGDFELNTADENIQPEEYSNDDLEEYGDGETKSTVVMIVCVGDEEEDYIKQILGEEGDLKKIYYASRMMQADE